MFRGQAIDPTKRRWSLEWDSSNSESQKALLRSNKLDGVWQF